MADDNGMVQPGNDPGLMDDRHQREFMEAVAKEISKNKDIVLKGGGALIFGYGLNRFSDDLDFDSRTTPELEKSFANAAAAVNVEINNIRVRKDTGTVKRYKVDYTVPAKDGLDAEAHTLKVEVSMRNKEFRQQDTRMVNGINVYAIEQLIAQKLNAFENRSIPRARDLNDLVFLAERHGGSFTREQTDKLETLIHDPDEVAFKFAKDHSANESKLPPLDDLILRLDLATQEIAARLERQQEMP